MRRRLLVLLTAAALVGCAQLPGSSPVHEGLERAPEPEGIVFLAPDPPPGGSPEEIVSGFLDAATAGVADRFETAQKYLTDAARSSWKPSAGVTIYSGSTQPQVQERTPSRVDVTVPVAGIVDERGVYTEVGADSTKTFRFHLTDEGGQWRIEQLDDGVLISAVNFGTQYRQVSLAYLAPDGEHIIPDPRWFPEQNSASFAVSALIDGPSDWLLPGVITAIPPGTAADPVSVSDGTAEVTLNEAALLASPSDRRVIAAQLEHTLTQLPQVRRVRILVDDIPFTDASHGLNLIAEPSVGHSPVIIHDDEAALVSGTTVTPLPTVLPADITALAVPYGDLQEAALVTRVGQDRLLALTDEGQAPRELVSDHGVLAPSYDRFDWVWTGPGQNPGTLVGARPEGEVVTIIDAPALAEHTVRALRVSRDGARLAMIVDQGGEVTIQVAMIQREEDGTPAGVTAPVLVGATVRESTDLAWVDSVTLAVLGESESGARAVHIVPLGGPSVALLSVPGASQLASGRGDREIWVVTDDGQLFTRAGNGWRRVGEDLTVTEVAFPG